jgi:hypothetical protein
MKRLLTMPQDLLAEAGRWPTMKIIQSFAVFAAFFVLASPGRPVAAAEPEGVALAIVYDTSGSMKQRVRDANGRLTPKHVIAKRALDSIVRRLQGFATNASGAPRRMEAGLFVFSGQEPRAWVKFGPFDGTNIKAWTTNLPEPAAGTPLGHALKQAGQAVLGSPLPRKHVLVITDGANTVGPDPAAVLPQLQAQAAKGQAGLAVHFVAFDVEAKLFAPLKKLGATVVGAANEPQLNTQLEFILEKKILLEDEEPPAKSGKN